MNNRPRPLCPWCGKRMSKYIAEFTDGKFGGHYGCGSNSCGASAPYVEAESWDECDEMAYQASMKRPLQKPIDKDTLFNSILVTPCWIETAKNRCHDRGSWHLFPDVLDADSTGCFGQLERKRSPREARPHYYLKAEYNKTWRCWLTMPTGEEQKAAAWEDDNG